MFLAFISKLPVRQLFAEVLSLGAFAVKLRMRTDQHACTQI